MHKFIATISINFQPSQIEDRASIIPLVAQLRKDVLNLTSEGIALVWESYKLDPYVQRLSENVTSFQEKVEDLLVVEEQLDVDVRSLETCPYSAATFADILSKIQHAVDDLSLRQYSNLHVWVQRLDEEVEKKLAARLQAGIQAWTDALAGNKKDVDLSMDTDLPVQPTIVSSFFLFKLQNFNEISLETRRRSSNHECSS